MKIKLSATDKIFVAVNNFLLLLLALTTIFPFIHMIALSFSTPSEAARFGVHIIPKEWSWDAYKTVFESEFLLTGYLNTIIITVTTVVVSLAVMTLMAYPLSKTDLVHRGFFTGFVVFTMFFSGGLIPSYLNIRNLGLIDSWLALILPMLVNTFNMLIIRNYFMTLPKELEEAATIDGANELYVFVKIIIPLSMPIIATVMLWTAVGCWNSWFECMLYIRNPDKFTLQVFLRRIIVDGSSEFINFNINNAQNQEVTEETVKAATILVSTLPIMCVYPFIQKYFVKGVMVGAVKG